jgi:hypothetical protein
MADPRSPLSRRSFLRLATAGGAAAALGWAGHAQEAPRRTASETGAEFITPETQTAIDTGLNVLARSQLDDGSVYDRFDGASVGITSLAGLALMAGGHQPGRGRYGRVVSRALDYVCASANGPNAGFLTSAESQQNTFRGQGDQKAMYSHGFGCLFLAEACGMLPDPARQRKVRGVLEQAIAYTVAAQNREGGWRYDPRPATADVSVTVAQMMALRAAKNAGVFVRKNVIDSGVQYIRDCQMADGGFSYFRGQGGNRAFSAFARSAAAIVGLYSAGIYEGREIDAGLRYLRQFVPGRQFAIGEIPQRHYYYGQYYAALAMWTAGGEHWSRWFPAIRDELLMRARQSGGAWTDPQGTAYATAMALIILQLPNNYLPILQK